MTTRRKKFDCVEMKNRIQAELMAEYMSCKQEFESYGEFITAKANADPKVRAWRQKGAKTKQRR